MSDVEYYLLEKDGENSKCGVLDLGKCMDSDENSASESTFTKESNNIPAKGENLEVNRSETIIEGRNQDSKSSDDQLLSFLSSEEGSSDVNPNRDAQSEKDVNVCKSPENMLKDLIESLPGNGVNSQGKNETVASEQITDMSHGSSAENTHPHSTKIQDEVADTHANSKSLTEILDDFCSAPTEIIAPSEMSFSQLVDNDDSDKTTSQNSQLQNEDIEMAEIWSGENTEKVFKNGTVSQGMKVEDLKQSKEEDMETEEDTENQINSSEVSNETEENIMDQPDCSEKSEESTETYADKKEKTEAIVDDRDNEEEMETAESAVEDKKMEEKVNSGQDEVGESETVVKNTKLEVTAADVNTVEDRDLGSSSKDASEEELESTAMETEEEESDKEESKEKCLETQEEGSVGELNSFDMEGNQSSEESHKDKHGKKSDDVVEDSEKDLADEETHSQEKSINLIEKETNVSEEAENDLVDDDRKSLEKSVSLTDKELRPEHEKEKTHDKPEDVGEEEIENSQKEKMKANVENVEHQSSEPVCLKENENITNINDKDSTDNGKEKSPEKFDDARNMKNLDTKHKGQNKTSEDKSVKLQVTSKQPETVVDNASKTSTIEKSPSKETMISETEKEIFEGPKPKSGESIDKARPKLPPKSAEDVTAPKGRSKGNDGSPVVVSTGKQSNTDDGFVDYDEESIENITKTIKSFTSESSLEKKQDKRNDSSKKTDSAPSKQVIVVKTSSNVERVKRKLEEILEKSKGEEDAAIAELQRMKKEKTDILNAITTEMEKLKAILVKGKLG